MTNSHNATSTKSCFSGILRRLLCTGSLPTHPSDSDCLDRTDFINCLPKKNEHEVKGGGRPGLVARLMGLDSLPANMTWGVPPNKDSIYGHLRSRSVSSADYFPQFDLAAQESYHRRVLRTSVSFREIPTMFLVCVDKNGDGQKSREDERLKMMAEAAAAEVKRIISTTKTSTPSTSGNKSNTTKERAAAVKKKKKENRENNKKKDIREPKRNCLRVENNIVLAHNKWNDVCVKSKMKREEVSAGIKRSKQRVKSSRAKKVEPEQQHSSVDSVAIMSGTMALNPAKKNSTPKVVNSVRKSNAVADDQEVARAIHITKSEKLMRKREVDFYIDKLVEVRRLTDEEHTHVSPNNWPWISSRSDQVIVFEDYQDICFDFGQEILEMLLQQLVDELNL